jgi:hypothetical protein
MGIDDSDYRRENLAWTRRNVVQTIVKAEDRRQYDSVTGKYTVDDLRNRYAGADSAIAWPI